MIRSNRSPEGVSIRRLAPAVLAAGLLLGACMSSGQDSDSGPKVASASQGSESSSGLKKQQREVQQQLGTTVEKITTKTMHQIKRFRKHPEPGVTAYTQVDRQHPDHGMAVYGVPVRGGERRITILAGTTNGHLDLDKVYGLGVSAYKSVTDPNANNLPGERVEIHTISSFMTNHGVDQTELATLYERVTPDQRYVSHTSNPAYGVDPARLPAIAGRDAELLVAMAADTFHHMPR